MIIEEKINRINHRKMVHFTIFLMISIFSCNTRPEISLPKEGMYFKFAHVKEIIDSATGITIKYELLNNPITTVEKNTLVKLLDDLNWKYKVTTDSNVLIQATHLGDIAGLNYLDGELDRKLRMSRTIDSTSIRRVPNK